MTYENYGGGNPNPVPFGTTNKEFPNINLIRNPTDIFGSTSYFYSEVSNPITAPTVGLANTGGGATWTTFPLGYGGGNALLSVIDPLTGNPRLIAADDHGIYSAVDDNGLQETSIGTDTAIPTGSRNGNLSIAELVDTASQPSSLAALAADALFYGMTTIPGTGNSGAFSSSDPNILTDGNLSWTSAIGDGSAVAADQTGTGTLYQYMYPCCGANPSYTDFFLVNGTSRTFNIIQTSSSTSPFVPDAQWPYETGFKFAVNPISSQQIIMGSNAGRIFSTSDGGETWQVVGDPQFLDGSVATALAFGAPDPADLSGALNDFLYAGTQRGNIFVTFTGGGNSGQGNQWTNLSAGLDGSPVEDIITDPDRGSHEAYAVTEKGVYWMADSTAANATWVSITGNLLGITQNYFGPFAAAGTPLTGAALITAAGAGLTSIEADWRYAIPNSAAELNNPTSPPGPTHPVLYIGGSSGVYRSVDNGATWTVFPSMSADNAPINGGYLPNAQVTSLNLALGNIDPTTGRGTVATSPDLLLASTYGAGDQAILVPPTTVAGSLQLDPSLPSPGGSQTGSSGGTPVTDVLQPVFDGMSEVSAFGNTVTVQMYDMTNPASPVLVSTAPVATDATGRFKIQLEPNYFTANGATDGTKVFGFQATDATGAVGPMVSFTFILNTTPSINATSVQFAPGSDSGRSATDKITNVIRPTIIGTVSQAAPVTVDIFDITNPGSPVLIGQGVTTAAGAFSIQINAGVYLANGTTDGVKSLELEAVHIPTNSTPVLFSFTLDTIPPAKPSAPALLAASDTGFSNSDHITDDTTPGFSGTGEANAQVLLFANGVQVGSAIVNTVGTYTVTVSPTPLTANSYNMTVQVVDVAGNVSAVSSAMQPVLVIQTAPPATPTLKLDPSSDTGTLGDNITAAIPALFDGTTATGTSVVIRDNGAQIDAFLQSTGATFQRSLNLANGVHTLTVTATNLAGNFSVSSPLVITISSTALDPNSKFIRSIYQVALGRPGSPAEWANWLPLLASGTGRTTIANAIERSPEARQFTVKGWYLTYLGRTTPPSNTEIQFWVSAFARGQTEEQVLSSILATAEYFGRGPAINGAAAGTPPSNTFFIESLYAQLLGRQASAGEISTFQGLVNSLGRQQVAYIILTSAEYRGDQVRLYYGSEILGRAMAPSAGEVNAWVTSGLDLTSIRVAFLGTMEYYLRITGLSP